MGKAETQCCAEGYNTVVPCHTAAMQTDKCACRVAGNEGGGGGGFFGKEPQPSCRRMLAGHCLFAAWHCHSRLN